MVALLANDGGPGGFEAPRNESGFRGRPRGRVRSAEPRLECHVDSAGRTMDSETVPRVSR